MSRAATVGTLRARLFGVSVVVLGGLLTHGTYAGTGDEPHYLAIAHSLAFDFDLDMSNNYGSREPLIADGGMQPDFHVHQGRGGVVRPVHDIGMPLLFAPYIRIVVPAVSWMAPRIPPRVMHRLRVTPTVLYRHLISAAMIVLAGVLATLMFDAFITIGLTAQTAFWTALLVALSPPLLIHGILFFTELPSALFCFIVFRRIALDERMASPWSWALAGGVAGMLLLIHVRNAGLVAGLVLIALHRLARRSAARELTAFLVSLWGLLIVRAAINYHLWGTWLTSPHARAGEWNGREGAVTAGRRLAGMLLDQEFGLLPYAPVFALAAVGVVVLARTRRALVWRVCAVAGCYVLTVILPITNVYDFTGGWSPVARFLVPIVPLLAIGVAEGIRATPRMLLVPLIILQIAIDGYAWQHPKNLWNDGDGIAAVCSRGGVPVCGFLPSFVAPK
jgi:hypothetical protein